MTLIKRKTSSHVKVAEILIVIQVATDNKLVRHIKSNVYLKGIHMLFVDLSSANLQCGRYPVLPAFLFMNKLATFTDFNP